MNQRISSFDIPSLLSGIAPSWASKTACAILGMGLACVSSKQLGQLRA